MTKFLAVFIGGGLGAMSRYALTTLLAGKLGNFPIGTFTANILGSFLMGVLLGIFSSKTNETLRLLLTVGFLGGFTTFSSFSAETLTLIREGQMFSALINIFASVGIGLAVCAVGFTLTRN